MGNELPKSMAKEGNNIRRIISRMTEEEREKAFAKLCWEWIDEHYTNQKFCEKHGIDPHTISRKELYMMVQEFKKAKWRAERKIYYEKNADKIIEKMQKHRQEHHEEILAKKKIYAQKKFTCECGGEVARNNLARHLETDKHKKFIHSKTPSSSTSSS
jgi:hypothetical protein